MRAVPDCTLAMGYYLIDFSNFNKELTMPRRMIALGKTVRRVVTIKTTKKPQPGRVVSSTPQGLPTRVVPNKTGGTRRIYYG